MIIDVDIVNAFTLNGQGGNAAGVVTDAGGLDTATMQTIAARLALSETAFVTPADDSDMEVRFFTPSCEIDFCGHATVASVALMQRRGLLRQSTLLQKTRAGILPVRIADDGEVLMNQPVPEFGSILDGTDIAAILGISAAAIGSTALPVRIVSTGLADILVPVAEAAILERIRPNFEAMAEYNRATHTIGVHVFTLGDTGADIAAYCRNFAPLFGIEEESATGSSAGALASYLNFYRDHSDRSYVFEQGRRMGQPSRISAAIGRSGSGIHSVIVGGYASPAGSRRVQI